MDFRCLGRPTNRPYQEFFPKLRFEPSRGWFERRGYSLLEGQPCSTGRAMLRTQLRILREPEIANSFECTDPDVEDAYPPAMVFVDSDQEGDSDIEVE